MRLKPRPVLLRGSRGDEALTSFSSAVAVEGAELFDRLRFLVVAFEAAFTQHFRGNARDEFGEGAFHAVAQKFLAGFGGPKFFFNFRERDSGFFGVEVFALGEKPHKFRIARQRDRERHEFQRDFLFVGNFAGALADFDIGSECAIGRLEFDVQGFVFFVLRNLNVIAKRVVELFFHIHDRGGFHVRKFDAFAKFFERGRLIFAVQGAFDVVDDFGGEIDVAGVFGQNCF